MDETQNTTEQQNVKVDPLVRRFLIINIFPKLKRWASIWAMEHIVICMSKEIFLLKSRYYSFIKTITAQLVRILKVLFRFIIYISKQPISNKFSGVLFFLSCPIYEALIFLFKIRYYILKHQELLLRGENTVDSLDKVLFQLCSCNRNLIEISNILNSHNNFFRRFKT